MFNVTSRGGAVVIKFKGLRDFCTRQHGRREVSSVSSIYIIYIYMRVCMCVCLFVYVCVCAFVITQVQLASPNL